MPALVSTVTTQLTPYQGEYMVIHTFSSLPSLSLSKSNPSSLTQLPPPTLLNSASGEKEHTPLQQPRLLTMLGSLLRPKSEGKQLLQKSITSSNNPSLATKSELHQCFNAPLTTSKHSLPSTAPPHPYGPSKECLRLWQPPPTQSRVTCNLEREDMHPITNQQVDRILKVIGASWAENTKEAYGTGLLTYHVFCNTHSWSEAQQAPIMASTLLAFLSSCTSSYSGSALSNFTASLRVWHLLHGRLFHLLMDLNNPRDAAIYACLTVVFYCIAHLAHVTYLHDLNSLPVTKFHIPCTKMSLMGEDAQCAPLNGMLTDPIQALEHHINLNPADDSAHLFAWKHPTFSHSLQIGRTLHFLLKGIPFDVVKMISRWVGDSFTIYLHQHAMILTPYLNDTPALLEHFTRYMMPLVH
ncbi:hypothetical protein BKA82DRAFT_4201284 [Pisolithus tinctorius]|nr:hypothetical protein BKA82DRAFT_4201284 [Pisolithus tinctorius]